MAAPRLFTIMLGCSRWSRPSLAKAMFAPTTTVECVCLRHRISCRIFWNPNPLRAFVTKTPRAQKSLVKTQTQKANEIFDSLKEASSMRWQLTRRLRDDILQTSRKLEKMQGLLWQVAAIFRVTPKRFTGAAVTVATGYTYWYHRRHRQKLPLNGRMAFHPMTDAEAIRRSSEISDYVVREIDRLETRVDHSGLATDPITKRVEGIMEELRSANYELDRFLLPGASWRPIVVEDNADIGFRCALTFACGDLLLAGDVIRQLDDDELSFIVAHEMTHAVQRHEIEWHGNNIFWYQFFSTILKPLKDYVVDFDIKTYMTYFADKIPMYDMKTCEMEADEFGFRFAARACYDFRKFGDGLARMARIAKEGRERAAVPSHLLAVPQVDPDLPFDDEIVFELEKSTVWVMPTYPPLEERIARLRSHNYVVKAHEHRKKKRCPALPSIPLTGVVVMSQQPGDDNNNVPTNQSQDNMVTESQNNMVTESQDNMIAESKDNMVAKNQDNMITENKVNLVTESQDNLLNQSQDILTYQSQDMIDSKFPLDRSQVNSTANTKDSPTDQIQENSTNLRQENSITQNREKRPPGVSPQITA